MTTKRTGTTRWGYAIAFVLAGCGGNVADELALHPGPTTTIESHEPAEQDAGALPSDPILDRYVKAICSCGDGWSGCDRNVRVEAQYANRPCLLRYAELYERACNGRLEDGGTSLGCML